MRLGVRDPADILRWAAGQNTRRLDDFRYRVVHGREFVSFRMVPRYAIEIGTADIVVVAHVQAGTGQRVVASCRALVRRGGRLAATLVAALKPRAALPAPAQTAKLYELAAAPRRSSSIPA
jgi:hypothetical protein